MPEANVVAMQTRCVHCGDEQYAPFVYKVSQGTSGCAWCGAFSTPMTGGEYDPALKACRDRLAAKVRTK